MGPEMSHFEQKVALLKITLNQPLCELGGYRYLCSVPIGALSTYNQLLYPSYLVGEGKFWFKMSNPIFTQKTHYLPFAGLIPFYNTIIYPYDAISAIQTIRIVLFSVWGNIWLKMSNTHFNSQNAPTVFICFFLLL